MKKIMGMLAGGVLYFCVATVIAQALIVGYLASKGGLSGENLSHILALAQGASIAELAPPPPTPDDVETKEERSLEEMASQRAIVVRDIELREQALRRGLDTLEAGRQRLVNERRAYVTERGEFERALAEAKQGSTEAGEENVRGIISNMKPKQAKELLLTMLERGEMNEVVQLLGEMPANKRKKIVDEFKASEEVKQVHEILSLMRRGGAEAQTIEDTQEALGGPKTAGR